MMEHNVCNPGTMQQMMAVSAQHPDYCCSTSPYQDSSYARDAFLFQPIHAAFTGGIESYLDPKYACDPAAFASRLPYLPFHGAYAMYDYGFEPAFIRKRNERERQRVKCVNEGYARLREHLPNEFAEKRLSKVETLRGAIKYIKQLQGVLGVDKTGDERRNKRLKPVAYRCSDDDTSQDELYQDDFSRDVKQTEADFNEEKQEFASDKRRGEFLESKSSNIKLEASSPIENVLKKQKIINENNQTLCAKNDYNNHTVLPTDTYQNDANSTNSFCRQREYSNSCLYQRNSVTNKTKLPLQARFYRSTSSCSFDKVRNCIEFSRCSTDQSSCNDEYPEYSTTIENAACSRYGKASHMNDAKINSDMQNDHDAIISPYYYIRTCDQLMTNKLNSSRQLSQANNADGYRSSSQEVFPSCLGNYLNVRSEGDSDGFKSDNSPSSSSVGTSP